MASRTALIIAFAATLITSVCVEARTWRPEGRPVIKGDFEDVVGTEVKIRTADGSELVPYAELSATDKAVVRSNLQSKGRADEAQQLDKGEMANDNKDPFSAISGLMQGVGGGNRVWTDIHGNKIQAEYEGMQGQNVLLKIDGVVKPYPVVGFSAADKDWLDAQGGDENSQSQQPSPQTGNEPTFPGPGHPGGRPGYPGMTPPAYPGVGGMNGTPGPPGVPNMPSGGRGSRGTGISPPGYPGSGASAGLSGPPDFPGLPQGGHGGGAGMMPGSQNMPYPGGGSGQESFAGGGLDMSPPGMSPPNIPQLPGGPPGMSGIGRFGGFEDVLKCENCGAEFTETSGLAEGDECPHCSNQSSSPNQSSSSSGTTSFRSSRGLLKGIAGIVGLIVAGVGFAIRKMSA